MGWIGVAEAATGLNTDALVDEGCRLALALIRALLFVGRRGSNGGGAAGVVTRTVVKSTVCPTGPRRRRTDLRVFESGDAVLRPAVAAVEDAR